MNTTMNSADRVLITLIFSLVSGCVSGLVYFALVLLFSTLFSIGIDFSEVTINLIVSYLFINIVGIFVALTVKMLFLQMLGAGTTGRSLIHELVSLLTLLVFLFVFGLPVYFFIESKFDIAFPVLVLAFYIFFNFLSSLYLSKSREEFVSILISLFLSFFVFFIIYDLVLDNALIFFTGVFVFPIIFLGFTELFLAFIRFFELFFYRTYGIDISNND